MKDCIIIGCGSIGAIKDSKYDSPTSQHILTIANAVCRSEYARLIGVYDVNKNKMIEAAQKWQTETSDINNMHGDIAFVCVDTKYHFEVINSIKDRFDTIVVEKPAGESLSDAYKIKSLIQDMKNPPNIIVNYTRRFEPTHKMLASRFKDIEIYSCIVKYTRGLKRDGCHAIDLMNYWFGDHEYSGEMPSLGFNDYNDLDLTKSYFMKFDKCLNVHFVPMDARKFSIFEIEIFSEQGRHILRDNGAIYEEYNIVSDGVYGSYPVAKEITFQCETGLHYMLLAMVDSVAKGEKLCTIDDAIKTHKIIQELQCQN